MTLPNGPIAFSNLRSIIGPNDSNTVSLSQYRPSFAPAYGSGIPGVTDTNISMSQFTGKSKILKSGFIYRIFTGMYFADNPAAFSTLTENYIGSTTDTSSINAATGGVVPSNSSWETYSVEWFGYFYATVTGTYTFYTVSDDASYVWVGSNALSGFTTTNCLVNNGGTHGATERSGTISLTAGTFYPIRCQYGENASGDSYTFSFSAPGIARTYNMAGYVLYSLGQNSLYPAESARIIKAISPTTTTDGIYYIIVNGISTATYCLMNNSWNGGGWMMMMKATRGQTFDYNSSYWTGVNTLNPEQTNRNNGDAKFNVMNYAMIKDVLAVWPDVGYTGGSITSPPDSWTWLVNNYYLSGTRATALTGFSVSRDSPINPDPITFAGFSYNIWSTQNPSRRHIFGGGSHIGTVNSNFRWGFIFNENAPGDFSSSDVGGGIGMRIPYGSNMNYSGGDAITCCQTTTGLNRSMRVELYGR